MSVKGILYQLHKNSIVWAKAMRRKVHYETSRKTCSRAVSNLVMLIPSRSSCQMLAILSGDEFY